MADRTIPEIMKKMANITMWRLEQWFNGIYYIKIGKQIRKLNIYIFEKNIFQIL